MTNTHALRRITPIAVAMGAALTLALGGVLISASTSDAAPASRNAFLEQLRLQVDTARGEPRPGRNPAFQQQRRLAVAAAQPNGIGRRVARPARAVRGDQRRRVNPEPAFRALRARGLSVSGCFIDYGRPGEQCLPVHAAERGVPRCDRVRTHFPTGIAVSGRDRFRLDRNRDGIACGPGD